MIFSHPTALLSIDLLYSSSARFLCKGFSVNTTRTGKLLINKTTEPCYDDTALVHFIITSLLRVRQRKYNNKFKTML